MPTPIGMPKLGMTMREGKVVAWPVAVGGRVERGAPVVVIESEKSEIEIDASASGLLRYVYVKEGETVPCGTLLGAIADDMDAPFDVEAFRREHDHPDVESRPEPAVPSLRASPSRGERPVTPAARARAKELGVDVALLLGTGPGGRVTREDVEAAAKSSGPVRLQVLEEGAGDSILLVPGFGSDVSVFARQIPALAAQLRVRGVNPRGVGASEAPPQTVYAVDAMAGDVAALLDAPAHVVGASLGAAIAIELALAKPKLVRSIVLVTPFVVASPRLLAVLDAWCALAATAAPEAVARAIVPWLFGARTLGDAAALDRTVRGFAAMQRQTPAATLTRQAAGLRAWSGTRAGDLARIAVPTLVVDAGDDLLTRDAEAMAAAIPDARLTVVRDAGHAVMLDAPEEITAAIGAHVG